MVEPIFWSAFGISITSKLHGKVPFYIW
jgi:hypothetical protein